MREEIWVRNAAMVTGVGSEGVSFESEGFVKFSFFAWSCFRRWERARAASASDARRSAAALKGEGVNLK